MKGKDTGLKDSDGNPIKDGDKLLWEYQSYGVETVDENGNKKFMGCFPADDIRTLTRVQIIKYEVRKKAAGYFLDIPCGMGTTGLQDKIKCKIIK